MITFLLSLNRVYRYKHAADKLQKTENVMEKYKKKLQEGADLRQHVRVCIVTFVSIKCLYRLTVI